MKKPSTKRTIIIGFIIIILFFCSALFFIAVTFDNDKDCSTKGGYWNEDKSRCEDFNGNKFTN